GEQERLRGSGGRRPATRRSCHLTFTPLVAGLVPGQDPGRQVVEHILPGVGVDEQHGVALVLRRDHDGDRQGGGGQALREQSPALLKDVVLAVPERRAGGQRR